MIENEDEPKLSEGTLKVLQEFLLEQALQSEDNISENWELSQFWYDETTTKILSEAAISLCDNEHSNIGLISCPTLYSGIKTKSLNCNKKINLILFEFDKRFAKYDPDFEFYDYNEPENIKTLYHKYFDVMIIDPPFLSEECLNKMVKSVELLRKPNSKIILCTGAVMEELAKKLLNIQKISFEPKHKNNLGNEFICLTNFGELPKTFSA